MTDDGSTSLMCAIAILNVLGSQEGTKEKASALFRSPASSGETRLRFPGHEDARRSGFRNPLPRHASYRVGYRVFALAASASDQRLLTLIPPVLRSLVARVFECAHLSVLEGRGVLTLMSESPGWSIQDVLWVGRIAPLHCTSAGRAPLFDHTDAEVRALLEEADMSVGAPVRDFRGRVAAARQASVRRILLTHPSFSVQAMSAGEVAKLAGDGCYSEVTTMQLFGQPDCDASRLAAFV